MVDRSEEIKVVPFTEIKAERRPSKKPDNKEFDELMRQYLTQEREDKEKERGREETHSE